MIQPTSPLSVTHDLGVSMRTRLFRAILWAVICTTTVYAFLLFLTDSLTNDLSILLVLIPFPICAFLLIMLRRGYMRFVAIVFTAVVWLLMFCGAAIAGGIQAPAYTGFILPILSAGWLLGKREGLFVALLSGLAGLFFVVSYNNGWIVALVINTDFSIWISQLFFLVIAAAILYISIDSSDRLIEQLKRSEQSTLAINEELRAEVEARKVAEKELQFQADVLSQVRDAIIVTNVEREIIYWNQGAEKLYGPTREQALNKSIDSVLQFDESENPENDERAIALLTTGVWQGDEETVVHATGKALLVESKIRLVLDEEGAPSHVIVSARDIHERIDAQNALQYRTEVQELVTQLATRFINLPVVEIDKGIVDALQLLCEFFEVERGVIAFFSDNLQKVHYDYEYYKKGGSLQPLAFKQIPTMRISWTLGQLKQFDPVIVPSVAALPTEAAADKLAFESNGTKSFIGIPLVQQKTLIGILGFSSADEKDGWSEDMLSQMQVLSQIIVNLLERRTFEEDLRTRDEELNATATQLSTLLEIDRNIFSAQTLQDVIGPALKRLFELSMCQCTSIMLFDDAQKYGYYINQYPQQELSNFTKPVPISTILDLDDLRDGIIVLNGHLGDLRQNVFEPALAAQAGITSLVRVPLKASSLLIGILYMGFDNSDTFERLDIQLLEGIATSLALAIANTQLYEQVQSHAVELEDKIEIATADLKHQYNLQAALAEIELAINEPSELQNVLEQIVTIVKKSLHSDKGVSIVLWDAKDECFVVSATSVEGQGKLDTAQRVRKQGGATRWILDHGELLIVADTKADPFGANEMIGEHGIGAYAGVPLMDEGHAIGVLYILMSQPQSFTTEQTDFMQTVTRRASLAITKVRLFEQTREVAMEDERKRLARDLHDAVSQSLFSASMIAESLPLLFERNPEMAKQELKNLYTLTQGAANEMRTLLFELRPSELTENTLSELVKQLCNAFAARTQIPISMNIDVDIHYPPRLQLGIYRIAQEALNNVTKYARARTLWVEMTAQNNEFRLSIRDDGRGFDLHNIPVDHVGIQIMTERAAEIGLTLEIESTINVGTTIFLYRKLDEIKDNEKRIEPDTNLARG